VAPEQRPFAALLGCADSRVPVELVYDQGFGDLFVVRVAGNVATSVEIASLEYGTRVLGASALIVLGHTNCGAVKAALAGGEVPGQISTLYQHIAPALDRKKMNLDEAIVANVRYQARKLKKGSTVIARLLKDQKLALVGGVFDLTTGTVKPVELGG
jgi:carbonic anhydrase